MADQKITITAKPSKIQQINVTSNRVANEIVATPDTSLYYSNLSKQWATKIDGLVVNEDYSSKYYAEKSKQSAETAKMEASAANALVPQLREDYNNYNEQLNDTKNLVIEEINASIVPVLEQIEPITTVANNIDTVTEIGENLDDILNKTVSVGKTTTGESGTNANVVNAGTKYNPILNFTIPRGERGLDGGMTAEYIEDTKTLDFYSESGTALNPKWGNIQGDISNQTDLKDALENKQPKGNYALKTDLNNLANKSEIPTQVSELTNDSNFATQTQVMQAIASIPQFKLSIVNALPETGEKMVLYFVPKDGADNDIYNEYVWLEQTNTFEFLGSTAVDLTDYVKKTDYADYNVGGVIRQATYTGVRVDGSGILQGVARTLEQYYDGKSLAGTGFVCKTTLDNVLTQYAKIVSLTQAEYDALETKNANTLYLIEE